MSPNVYSSCAMSCIVQLLSEEEFKCIEKIKTTGYTYMAAAGLTMAPEDIARNVHVVAMADYALRMKEQLHHVNEHSFNHFKIRIGELHSTATNSLFRPLHLGNT